MRDCKNRRRVPRSGVQTSPHTSWHSKKWRLLKRWIPRSSSSSMILRNMTLRNIAGAVRGGPVGGRRGGEVRTVLLCGFEEIHVHSYRRSHSSQHHHRIVSTPPLVRRQYVGAAAGYLHARRPLP